MTKVFLTLMITKISFCFMLFDMNKTACFYDAFLLFLSLFEV